MPRRSIASGWIPPLKKKYTPNGQAWAKVWLGGRWHHCGPWGSDEAAQTHLRLVTEWLNKHKVEGLDGRPEVEPGTLSVAELLRDFLVHADRKYRTPGGRAGSELCIYRILCDYVNELYGALLVADFRPKHLKAVRERFLQHRHSRRRTPEEQTNDPNSRPWSRRQVNDHVRRVIRIFRWGVEQDYVSPDTLHRLEAVSPLLRGETMAPDSREPEHVEWAIVEKTLPFLTKDAAGLVSILWLTGARSGELCRLATIDLDRSGPEWMYRPSKHKTAKRGKQKTIWFGPRAQSILQPFIDRASNPAEPLFRTCDEPRAYRWLSYYTPDSLADAVGKACRKAGLQHWSPKQLRSGRATEINAALDLEHAAAVLGDRLDTTRHHYSRSVQLSRAVARDMG